METRRHRRVEGNQEKKMVWVLENPDYAHKLLAYLHEHGFEAEQKQLTTLKVKLTTYYTPETEVYISFCCYLFNNYCQNVMLLKDCMNVS